MLENVRSVYILQWIFSLLKESSKLKIIAYNKKLQAKFLIDFLDYKKNADNYLIKEKDGTYKIKSFKNNLITYEGGYLNGKKHGKGKEYKSIKMKYSEFEKKLIKNLKI